MVGEVTLSGNLVINAKSPQYAELIWKKSIALTPASFKYAGSKNWDGIPGMQDELEQDNAVYNAISAELEKFYKEALNLVWRQIDPAEMIQVAEQSKKVDKR